MRTQARRMLEEAGAEDARDFPAEIEPALRAGTGSYRRRLIAVYAAFVAVSTLAVIGLLAIHPATAGIFGSAQLTNITLTPASLSLEVDQQQALTAEGRYSDGTKRSVTTTVAWTTDDPGIATVDEAGVVTAHSPGTAAITASEGDVHAAATVTVTASALTAVIVTPALQALERGEHAQLTAEGRFSDGTVQSLTTSAVWTSSDPAVAVVDPQGNVTARDTGTATITATVGDVAGTATITVEPPAQLTGITIAPDPVALEPGATEQLRIIGDYSDGSSAPLDVTPTWTTSADKIVQVDEDGLITAVGDDAQATITAVLEGFVDTVTVTVAPALKSIAVQPAQVNLQPGESTQLAAIGTYSDGSTRDLTSIVDWLEGNASIASITPSGVVTGEKSGTTEVKAALTGLGGTATIKVSPIVE